MSAFYDLASLVLVPSGYKASKVYAQKPLTTDGQLTFSRASTATRVNSAGLIEEVASNVPRLDYLNSSCPKLLLEPSRTNTLLNNGTIIGTATSEATPVEGPDGISTTGRRPIPDTSSRRFGFIYPGGTFATGAVLTWSWFVKVVGTPSIPLPSTGQLNFTAPINNTVGTPYKVADYVDGWERWAVQCTIIDGASATTLRGYYGSIIGVGNDAIAYARHQVEVGAYPTSVINTGAAAVTRLADACNKTGISSLIGQTEGTLFVEFNNLQELDIPEITLDDGTNNNRLVIARSAVSAVWGIFSASAGVGGINYGTTTGNSGKFALAYSAAGYVLYRNGVQIATRTAALPVSLSAIRLNGRATSDLFGSKNVSQALLFKTRLTNAQLAELTSL